MIRNAGQETNKQNTHANSVRWTSQTAALVWWSSYNDGVMEVTLRSMEVAASASVVAGKVGMVAGFCCDSVHSVSLAALHQIPHDKDGGIVALRDRWDTSEGAGGWGKRQVSLTDTAACMNFSFTSGLDIILNWDKIDYHQHIYCTKSEICYLSASRWWHSADSHTCYS